MKRILILIAAMAATSPASAAYSELRTECLDGMVIARSITKTFQLLDEHGKPKTCKFDAKAAVAYQKALAVHYEKIAEALSAPLPKLIVQ